MFFYYTFLYFCSQFVVYFFSKKEEKLINLYVLQSKKKHEKGSSVGNTIHLATRVEKEYLKPSYTACIGKELEDGLFDGNDHI